MEDSFGLLCKLTQEERNNQDTISRLSLAKICRSLTKKESNDLHEAMARQTEKEIEYRDVLRTEFK